MGAPKHGQKKDANEQLIIDEIRYSFDLRRFNLGPFGDYYPPLQVGLGIEKQDASAGFDWLVIHGGIFVVEIKNPETLNKNGDLTKNGLTDNEKDTRRRILAAGGDYHIVIFANDLCFILGLPLKDGEPLSTLACDYKDPCICSRCLSTFESTKSDDFIFDHCPYCHQKHTDAARPKLKRYFIDEPSEPLVW